MLKLSLLLFAILQTSLSGPPMPVMSSTVTVDDAHKPLAEGITQKILEVLPVEEMKELSEKHIQTDPGFQAAIKYFRSPEWEKIISDIRNTPQWVTYKEFLKDAGFDLEPLIRHISHCVSAVNLTDVGLEQTKPTLTRYITALKTNFAIPMIKSLNQFGEIVGKDEKLKADLEEVISAKSKELFEKTQSQPALKLFFKKLRELDVPVDDIKETIYTFVGWTPVENVTTRP